MLSDRNCRLLTAYVDGELHGLGARAVERLLQSSAEARALLRQLQADANALRRLPRKCPEADLTPALLNAIGPDAVVVLSPAYLRPQRAYRPRAAYAIAAAVLVAVAAGLALMYPRVPTDSEPPAVARKASVSVTAPHADAMDPDLAGADFTSQRQNSPPKQGTGLALERIATTKPIPAKSTNEFDANVLAMPSPKLELFQAVTARPTFSLALAELGKERLKKQLRNELGRQTDYRLELFSSGHPKALDRLEAAFAAHRYRFLIESVAQARLRVPNWKTDFVLYVEGLTPDELERILYQAGTEEPRRGGQKNSAPFAHAVLLPLSSSDRQELAKLIGADPSQVGPGNKAPLGVDVRQPLAATTADQVLRTLAGQGTPRPEAAKPVIPSGPPRWALVLAYNPVRQPQPAASPTVKQFLDSRTKTRPGTLRILLVLRGISG